MTAKGATLLPQHVTRFFLSYLPTITKSKTPHKTPKGAWHLPGGKNHKQQNQNGMEDKSQRWTKICLQPSRLSPLTCRKNQEQLSET